MRNRKTKFEERPTNISVGNNNHWSRIKKIKEYLSSCEDNESDFKSIWLWMNENTRQGVLSNSLGNILGKTKCFVKVDSVSMVNPTTGIWGRATIYKQAIYSLQITLGGKNNE